MNGKSFILVIVAFLQPFWFGFAGAFAHEFETGHIERSVDVVVRDRQVQIKYAIGLSDTTILDWLVAEKMIDASEEARFRKCIVDVEKEVEVAESKDVAKDVAAAKKAPSVPQGKSSSTPVPSASADAKDTAKVAEPRPATEPLQFQTELMTLLQEKLSESILENLDVNCGGNSLEKCEIASANSARHHVSLEIAFSVALPDAEKYELSIVDRNFLDLKAVADGDEPTDGGKAVSAEEGQAVKGKELRYFGNIRLACRVKGKIVQLSSNVARVLARVKPVSVGPLDREQRIEAATIRTKLAFATGGKP